jgi:hypothetical protein
MRAPRQLPLEAIEFSRHALATPLEIHPEHHAESEAGDEHQNESHMIQIHHGLPVVERQTAAACH